MCIGRCNALAKRMARGSQELIRHTPLLIDGMYSVCSELTRSKHAQPPYHGAPHDLRHGDVHMLCDIEQLSDIERTVANDAPYRLSMVVQPSLFIVSASNHLCRTQASFLTC